MKVQNNSLPGVMIIEPDVYGDERGFFKETWNRQRYSELGLDRDFVQDNVSFSRKGILRGLHFQNPNPQGKLVQVLQGEVYDVAVDVRVGSPDFGRWVGVTLSAQNHLQLYIPEGFAHGFCVTSETALFCYKCTDFYDAESEYNLRWDDPDLAIEWPVAAPELSTKDEAAGLLRDIPRAALPLYRA